MRGGFAIISCLSGYSDKAAPHPAFGHLLPQEKAYKKGLLHKEKFQVQQPLYG